MRTSCICCLSARRIHKNRLHIICTKYVVLYGVCISFFHNMLQMFSDDVLPLCMLLSKVWVTLNPMKFRCNIIPYVMIFLYFDKFQVAKYIKYVRESDFLNPKENFYLDIAGVNGTPEEEVLRNKKHFLQTFLQKKGVAISVAKNITVHYI